jgi:RNA polymerase sigma-70 factor (ECF subfamily)
MDTRSDQEIAEAVCLGDKDLFGVLIDRYEEKITRYIRRFTQSKEDMEDIVQVVFIKAFTHLKSFDTTQSFNAWIYRIAHNESVNLLKKRGNEKVAFIDFDTFFPHPFAKEEADKESMDKELKTILDTSLNKLSSKYREVLILYYYDELSYQEIANILHIPTSTVGVRIRRAKEQLKEHLDTVTP